ncbi:MAG: Mur ligase family protein [Sphaerochaetaceae bacterium]|jgi:UDP-N-acetylmuramoylalanine--D-glutamate ligase
MRVLIFGLGLLGGGFSSAQYFVDRGDEVRITDLRSEEALGEPLSILKRQGVTATCGYHDVEDVLWADIVIKNPAVSGDNPFLEHAKRIETDISYLLSSHIVSSVKKIAVTGTKGKTYTVAALTHILNTLGHETLQFGNMGISGFSVLSELEKRVTHGYSLPEYVVCELSSWQIKDLYTIMGSNIPSFQVVALTSLFPDHQDWYNDFQSYKDDKWLLLGTSNSRIIMSETLVDDFVSTTRHTRRSIKTIESYSEIESKDPRIRVAWAISRSLGLGPKQMSKAIASFHGVPHRQEQVAIRNNIVFINDSSATIPESVAFSTLFSPWPIHLICGGTDKNLNSEAMLEALKRALTIHLLDGTFTRDKLIPLLEKHNITYQGPFLTMKDAFQSAFSDAQASLKIHNTVTLMLSPGAASFGLFLHEFDRGNQFKEEVFRAIEEH